MVDEFAFIHSITPGAYHHQAILTGIGDDAARYRINQGEDQLVCTDTMVEGVHFLRQTMPPYAVGWKLLASNLSDIAAMGGVPDYYLVSAAFPEKWFDDREEIFQGMSDLADRYMVDLIGGDTVSAPDTLVLSATVIGHMTDHRSFLRGAAKPGDSLMVTGTLGDSAAGLELLQNKRHAGEGHTAFLIQRHQLPLPRLDAADLIRRLPYRAALNDISDGLASEAYEIADASHVSIVIEREKLPVSEALSQMPGEDQLKFVLNGGEDYELLLSVPSEAAEDYQNLFQKNHLLLTNIGKVIKAQGKPAVFLEESGRRAKLEKSGYNHFKK
ncbi:thiamine-phosphate kinase [Sporolactobacillus sp. THM7-7]|nr:thiamine-phosphate kinase [Sporolactobacillus sp. THM7-7]